MGKEIDLVCSSPILPILSFLPKYDKITPKLDARRNFIISLDTSKAKVASFSYDFSKDGKRLNIYITPKEGAYEPKDVASENFSFGYDLICILDNPDLENLGLIYERNTDLFYNTPIINIDHNPSNEHYGEVNLVDITASSCCEILYSLIESLGSDFINDNVATCLLAGIISSTSSFQNPNTTPKSLTCAAQLVALGADQQKIVQNLYKSKTLSSLKLWGRALARIKIEPEAKLVWTLIGSQDFEKAQAKNCDLSSLIEELSSRIPEASLSLVLSEEKKGEVLGLLKANRNVDLVRLANHFNTLPESDLIRIAFKNKGLTEVEKEVIGKIKEFQKTGL
jgi:phosphoesterase RecJ-like protein